MAPVTRFALARRRLVALAWIALTVVGAVATPAATSRMTHSFATPGSPGYDTNEQVRHRFGIDGNVEIAARLHLSPLTAKTPVSRILGKLGARDRVQLVVMAYQTGLVAAPLPAPKGGGRLSIHAMHDCVHPHASCLSSMRQ
jgi:hypothetical protein